MAANIATADSGTISRIIAGWPALALLIAVKLLSGILEHRNRAQDPADDQAGPQAIRPHRAVAPPARPQFPARPASPSRGGLVPAEIAALEQAARSVRDELHRDGRPLTRDALAARLRAAGHPVRNDRLTILLAALRAEPAPR